jgi:hypothetical protein
LWEVHFCVPQNFLSLTENNQFRSSQLTRSGKTLWASLNNIAVQGRLTTYNDKSKKWRQENHLKNSE